ncbi:MAG: Gfo/Idh/MocA family oxidoreductase [Pirellulaceae bacterium]|jgi:predicted dehydrogenase|nr:Gfo/Idh/MocA family oxidoreductase [Pirellulaceae bacterium]
MELAGGITRRGFLKTSAAAAGAAALGDLRMAHGAAAGELGEVKIGLVGCGGRGTGALLDALGAATKVIYPQLGYHTEDVAQGATVEKKDIKVAALADLFEDRLSACKRQIEKLGIQVPANRCFTGFDACEQLLALAEVNYVILATPPHFRPEQLRAAVGAGKHVFMEKPAAVDVAGVKTVIAAGQAAKDKGLGIGAGTQRRHMKSYQETIRRIRDGAIGEPVYAQCYWNGGQIWVVPRQPGWSDIEWQLRNWNYFTWLSGDHYVEQHVHNLDIMNWVLGSHPVRAVSAIGGRQVRTSENHGHIFDHFAVEFEYPGGVRMFSQARQINGCQNLVQEAVVGVRGTTNCRDFIAPREGPRWRFREQDPNPYRQEHENLIASIRVGRPINEAQTIAEATMTGILGREAAYSGKALDWDAAMRSTTRLGPEKLQFGDYPIPPVAMPGTYAFS